MPAVVLEIVAGIVVGPSVLGWVEIDDTIAVVATLGLAFLLFLAGLEIDFARLRGPVLKLTGLGFALSFALALLTARGARRDRACSTRRCWSRSRSSATSLGVLIPVLKDAGESGSTLGQLVIAAGSIADFGAIILLSIFFTGEGGTGATLLLIGALFALAAGDARRGARARSARPGSAPTCCACRTPPPRSACAARWCCWWRSRRSRSRSGWRRSSARSRRARS